MSRNKTESEFILISTMWAKDKQSEIQMVNDISICKGKFQQLPSLMGEKYSSLKKILPVHHGCNPNGKEYSHKLKIRQLSQNIGRWTSFSK